MTQYCCRLDSGTLLTMNSLGNGWYQCPRCTQLRRTKDGVVERVSQHETRSIAEANRRRETEELEAEEVAERKARQIAATVAVGAVVTRVWWALISGR